MKKNNKIKFFEADYMVRKLPITQSLLSKLNKLNLDFSSITDEEASFLRDLCGERLQLYGFDEDYKMTKEGELLENLIDKLYRT